MTDLNIPQSNSSPAIRASWADGVVTMKGDSYPENSFELFQPLIDWVDSYLKTAGRALHSELELLYLNTSSIRALMDVLDMLEGAHVGGGRVSARWSYDSANERVGDLAEEFKEDCTFPFEIVATGDRR